MDTTLAELGEIAKAAKLPPHAPLAGRSRVPLILRPRPSKRQRAEVRAMRNSVRDASAKAGTGDRFNNYGMPHNPRLDGPVPYATKKRVADAVGQKLEEGGSKVGDAMVRSFEAGGTELGRAAGASANEVSRNARASARNVGFGILGAGAVGGTAFGAAAGARRRRSGKENIALDRKSGKLQVV